MRWGLTLGVWGAIGLIGAVVWYGWDLPRIDNTVTSTRRPAVTFLAENGAAIAIYGDYFAGSVDIDELPPYLVQAVIATEDRRFFEHLGLDPIGLARAAYVNLRAGAVREGGSTITQQLAKNLFLSPERSLRRKVQEGLIALWLEARFTKEQIFSIYLNRVYFGAGAYGIEAASRRYFGRSAREVSLAEAAMLAGLLKAPSRYSPLRDREAARDRSESVLFKMAAAGFLTEDEAAMAARAVPRYAQASSGMNGRYFTDWAHEQLAGLVGQRNEDLVVVTTLDPDLQKIAETELALVLDRDGEKRNVDQGAFIALTHDGAVRSLVGGYDYADSQFNRAARALRQPGSAFKLFVYAAALEAGVSPGDTIVDGPLSIQNWRPENFDGKFRGSMTIRDALAHSINTVSVQLTERVGRERVIDVARRMGIGGKLQPHPSIALGAVEVTLIDLTAAYAVIANAGRSVLPHAIVEVRDTTGRVLYRRRGSGAGQAVAPHVAATLSDLLGSVVAYGTGKSAAIPGRAVAGKTGTSQDFRDAWFIGFADGLIAGAWVGNDDSSPMKSVTGGGLPAEIWRNTLAKSLALRPRAAPVARDIVPLAPTPAAAAPRPPGSTAPETRSRFLDLEAPRN